MKEMSRGRQDIDIGGRQKIDTQKISITKINKKYIFWETIP